MGIKLYRNDHGAFLVQKMYILDLIHDSGFALDSSVKTPCLVGLILDHRDGTFLPKHDPNRKLAGGLLYPSMAKLYVSYDVQHLNHTCGKINFRNAENKCASKIIKKRLNIYLKWLYKIKFQNFNKNAFDQIVKAFLKLKTSMFKSHRYGKFEVFNFSATLETTAYKR